MSELYQMKEMYANIGKLITSNLDLESILKGIMEEIHRFFEPENWSLLRYDPNSNELFFVIAEGIDQEHIKDIRLKVGEGIAGTVAHSKKPVFVPDTSIDPRFTDKVDKKTGFKTKSIIAVPLIFKETLYGIIEIINRTTGGVFSEDDYLVLKTIADFSAIAFANAMLYEQSLLMGTTDPLTGLYNRIKLEEIIDDWTCRETFQRREEDGTGDAAVIMIDLDNFKQINDNHGHIEGDRVLKHLARLLRSSIRNEDYVFRVGGDEFLVIIPISRPTLVTNVEERIINKIHELLSAAREYPMPLRFSYGLAIGPAVSIKQLIHKADIKMYEQKKSGTTW